MRTKPLCVDCNKLPMKQYCRCEDCLREFEKRSDVINDINRVPRHPGAVA